MKSIKLQNAVWHYDEAKPLGPAGGFGEVFEGSGDNGKIAVKRLKLSVGSAAKREMKIGEALADKSFEHVVPVFDFGQDAESDGHFLIMPVCERSLHDYLDEQGVLNPTEAFKIISQILSGLIEVGDLVHRDLKPANVLFHEGEWKIADFGIAKFVEDATSLETLREGLTPLYGAPEQWRGERPSHATDVYALGCIFHALVTGNPPFYVGDRDDVREAHLSKIPAILSEVDAKVGGFIAQMLRKSPESRPSLQRCLSVLSVAAKESEKRQTSPVRQALAAVGRQVSEREAAAEAERNDRQEKANARRSLADEARAELVAIRTRLFDEIQSHVTNAHIDTNSLTLGQGRLDLQESSRSYGHREIIETNLGQSDWDVAENGYISVRCNSGGQRYEGGNYDFSATLVFASTPVDREFRWREVAFWSLGGNVMAPYSLNPFDRDFHVALSNTMHVHNVAYGPYCIDGEAEEEFQERWLTLFAKAAGGELRAPMHLPIQPSYFQ